MTKSKITVLVVLIIAAAIVASLRFGYFQKQEATYARVSLISDAFLVANDVKTAVLSYYFKNRVFPSSNSQAGLPTPETYGHNVLDSITVKKDGHIWLRFNAESGVDNGLIVLIPTTDFSSQKLWKCKTDTFKDITAHFPECECVSHLEVKE